MLNNKETKIHKAKIRRNIRKKKKYIITMRHINISRKYFIKCRNNNILNDVINNLMWISIYINFY